MLKVEDLENSTMILIFDYYDIPLTFIFELDSKLYYANLIDFKEDTNTEVYWVNEVTKEQYGASLDGKTSHYELMTQLEEEDSVYFVNVHEKKGGTEVKETTYQQAYKKYHEDFPEEEDSFITTSDIFLEL